MGQRVNWRAAAAALVTILGIAAWAVLAANEGSVLWLLASAVVFSAIFVALYLTFSDAFKKK